MAKTIAEVRKFNRDRRAKQRAAARAAGVPAPAQVHAALAEAAAFVMRSGVNIGENDAPRLYVDSGMLIKSAVDILARRGGYDLQRSREAVAKVVSPRPEHVWPGYVPSHTKSIRDAGVSG